ncbi:MAG: queuosine precursor transporter [Acidiferrobacterales bacterium]
MTSFLLLVGAFVSSVVVANVTASKVVELWGLTFAAGALAYCITFPITDVVTEVWGKTTARKVVWAGLMGNIVMIVLIPLAVISPPAPFYEHQDAYARILGFVPRTVLASIVAYLIAQLHDVWAFHFWSRITGGRHLWLRNNLSTMTSQFIDSAIFVLVAFAGVFSWEVLVPIFIGQYVVKLVIAALDTPVVYVLVHLCRGRGHEEWSH